MINYLRFSIVALAALATMSCSIGDGGRRPGRAEAEFVPGTPIPTENFRLENVQCNERAGSASVDGESVAEQQWVIGGNLVNLLDIPSPNYHLDVRATLSDGTTFERDGRSFFPLGAGETGEFLVFVAGQTMFSDPTLTVSDCEVVVLDSVLNYGR